MEKVTTVLDEKVYKELFKSTRVLTWVLAGLGGFGVGYYFMYSILSQKWSEPVNIILAVVGVIFIAFGFFFDYRVSKAIKLGKNNPITTVTEFNEDHFIIESYKNDEKTGESKIEYKSFKYYIVKTNYVYMTYENNSTFAFTKSDELIELLNKVGIKKK